MSFASSSDTLGLFLGKLLERSKLEPQDQEAILALPAAPRRVQAHGEIVRLGEQLSHCCLVADGLVSRFAQMEDGRRQHISLHMAGDMVDLYSLMLPAAPSPLIALTASTVFHVPHAALRELIARRPALAAAFWRECVVDANIAAQWLVSVGRRDARGRLAHLFCEMATRANRIGRYRAGSFSFPVTQEQLADALGLTPVHVNRSLQSMRRDDLVRVTRAEVTILDWDGLADIAEFQPDYLYLRTTERISSRAAV